MKQLTAALGVMLGWCWGDAGVVLGWCWGGADELRSVALAGVGGAGVVAVVAEHDLVVLVLLGPAVVAREGVVLVAQVLLVGLGVLELAHCVLGVLLLGDDVVEVVDLLRAGLGGWVGVAGSERALQVDQPADAHDAHHHRRQVHREVRRDLVHVQRLQQVLHHCKHQSNLLEHYTQATSTNHSRNKKQMGNKLAKLNKHQKQKLKHQKQKLMRQALMESEGGRRSEAGGQRRGGMWGRRTWGRRQGWRQKWSQRRAEMCSPRQAVLAKSSIWKACGLCMPKSHSLRAGSCSSRHLRSVCVSCSRRKSSTLLEQMKPTMTSSMTEMPKVMMLSVAAHCGMQQCPSTHSRLTTNSTNENPVRMPLNCGAGAAAVRYSFTLADSPDAYEHPLLASLEKWNSGTVPSSTSRIDEFVVVIPTSFTAKKELVSMRSTSEKNSAMLPSWAQSSAFCQNSSSVLKASLQYSSLAHLVSQATLMAMMGTPSAREIRNDLPSVVRQIYSKPGSRGWLVGDTFSLVTGQSALVFTQQPLHWTSGGLQEADLRYLLSWAAQK